MKLSPPCCFTCLRKTGLAMKPYHLTEWDVRSGSLHGFSVVAAVEHVHITLVTET